MKVAYFSHSLVSDWNHGNAHFLRGIVAELIARGHQVSVFEPENSWSRANLLADHGDAAIESFQSAFPDLRSVEYQLVSLDLDRALDGASLVIAHEWNEPELISRLGAWRSRNNQARLLFHDTHHRAVTAPAELERFDLVHYDGVLAYGASLREAYLDRGWGAQVWVWHEAADTRVFYPRSAPDENRGDLVWVGNWGDEERSEELREFLIEPARRDSLRTEVYGVRYPAHALSELAAAGIGFGGWLANFKVPEVFARFKTTVHVPRRPYVRALPGIPTIRPFEALACGIPLVSAPWPDTEHLFRPGHDFLLARDGSEMSAQLRRILNDEALSAELASNGLETIRSRHTCAHRVDELLQIFCSIAPSRVVEPESLIVTGIQ
jgi:spore maturation protein CgeB